MPSKTKTITLRDQAEEFQVKLSTVGGEFVYKPSTVTRSSQRKIRRIQWALAKIDKRDLPKHVDDDGDEVVDLAALSEEQLETLDEDEVKAMRLLCDMISESLNGPDEAPPAGDVLFEGWEQDEIAEHEVYKLLADMSQAREEDPTPA